MILRIDRLAIELPPPAHPSPNSASAVQELLGGKFGEMSTLMNYTFQSFNFRGSEKMKRSTTSSRTSPLKGSATSNW
jgi:Mn-containing catalase